MNDVGTEASESARPLATFVAVSLGLTPVVLGVFHGGYFPSSWLAFSIAAAALVMAVRFGAGGHHPSYCARQHPAMLVAVGLFFLFASWNLLSTTWAADAPAALSESTRVVFYGLTLTATAAFVCRAREVRMLLSSYVLGCVVLATATVVLVSTSTSPENYFRWIKLTEPIGYYNAEATFFLMPAMIAVHLASARRTAPWLRTLLLPGAVVLMEVAILTQSRGGFWAFVAGVAAYFVIAPSRTRALLWWAPTLALVVYAFDSLNRVHIDLDSRDLSALVGSIDAATNTVLVTAVAASLLAAAMTALDMRIVLGRHLGMAARIVTGLVFLGVLVAIPIRFPALAHPIAAGESAWDQFKGSPSPPSEVRILNLDGSSRYQLWQVAWRAFQDAPATGVGADNYAVVWNRTRPMAHDVLQPHNLYLRLLSELGLPGLLLFLGVVLTAVGTSLLRVLSRSGDERGLVAGILGAGTVFAVHAAADWVWHMPSVGAAFFVLLGLLNGPSTRETAESRRAEKLEIDPVLRTTPLAGEGRRGRHGLRHGPSPITVVVFTAAIMLVLAVPQLISVRLTDRAAALLAQGEPELALRAASWAERSNPLADRPHVIAGEANATRGDTEAAEREFLEATHKNPANWHTYLIWGDSVATSGGDPRELYQAARDLNPLSPELELRFE